MAEVASQLDIFERVRRIAVALMLAAGLVTALGSVIDWVVIAERPQLRSDFDFGSENPGIEKPTVSRPFSGVEATYGLYSLAGGVAIALGGALLAVQRRGRYALVGFAGAVVAGAIAIAAYRGIADQSSALYQHMDIVGRAEPALGLTLVAGGAIVGLIASVLGLAATPYQAPED